MCWLNLLFSHAAEYTAVQADITNSEAQRVHPKGSQEDPAIKERPSTLGKGNLAELMAGEGILDAMQERNKRTERKHQRRQRRQLAQISPHRGPSHLFQFEFALGVEHAFSLWILQQGFCAQQPAPSLVSATLCLYSLPVSCRTTQILNPLYLLLPPMGIPPPNLYSSPSTGRNPSAG